MSGHEQRLTADKNEIRRRVSQIGGRVGGAISAAVAALLARDEAACSRIILGDLAVNRDIRAIDKLCHSFVARHLPSAGHLRFVSSVLRMNVALERIGDYAVTIAREGVQLSVAPPEELAGEMRAMASQSVAILEQAMKAFAERDAPLARKTKPEAKLLGRSYSVVFRDLVRQGGTLPTADAFALLVVFHRLERVADQAKNVCEETLFELTGETKPPKRYQVLFVGSGDPLLAPLAVALARKAFPESADYWCAGYPPGVALPPVLTQLADEYSLDLSGLAPRPLDKGLEALERFHVVVCLSRAAREQLPGVPYSTAVVVWDLPAIADGPEEQVAATLREHGRRLTAEIHELLVTLRGEDAN